MKQTFVYKLFDKEEADQLERESRGAEAQRKIKKGEAQLTLLHLKRSAELPFLAQAH